MRFLKRILLFCLGSLILYAIVAIIFQRVTGTELSPTLTERFYSVFGIELAVMAALKISENIEKRRDEKIRKEKEKAAERKTRQQEKERIQYENY